MGKKRTKKKPVAKPPSVEPVKPPELETIVPKEPSVLSAMADKLPENPKPLSDEQIHDALEKFDRTTARTTFEPEDRQQEPAPAPAKEMPVGSATVNIPIAKLTFGYEPRRVDVSGLSQVQRANLRRITNGLIAGAEKLENGKTISRPQDAIKWILEKVNV
jgi:hypothetical protein